SRLVFDRAGMLFVTLGERHDYREQAQNPMSHLGKVVRIRPDGGIPADNPFVGKTGWLPEIWSLGHRNVQGAALHPATGELWISEHGPQGGDEINIVRRGRNYGWPIITYGCEYVTCARIGEGKAKAGLEQPVSWWEGRSIAPAGIAFCSGRRFPEWRGNLFVGALAGEAVWRLVLNGDRVESREPLPIALGERIRSIREGPDGWLYLLTDGRKGQVMRIVR
ncbi:MAG: PQQ-dependent sugar dehydrogenase, partial [Zoogloea sp.]|nr:PQQ-dependent sugar dehydrogenase [Zoogloea sp.]